jgi:hypothetical protein
MLFRLSQCSLTTPARWFALRYVVSVFSVHHLEGKEWCSFCLSIEFAVVVHMVDIRSRKSRRVPPAHNLFHLGSIPHLDGFSVVHFVSLLMEPGMGTRPCRRWRSYDELLNSLHGLTDRNPLLDSLPVQGLFHRDEELRFFVYYFVVGATALEVRAPRTILASNLRAYHEFLPTHR